MGSAENRARADAVTTAADGGAVAGDGAGGSPSGKGSRKGENPRVANLIRSNKRKDACNKKVPLACCDRPKKGESANDFALIYLVSAHRKQLCTDQFGIRFAPCLFVRSHLFFAPNR